MAESAAAHGAAGRTLELLRFIASGDREFALKDIADRAGLAASTAHRLIEQWVRRDLLERSGPKAYRMGPELFRLASLVLQKFAANRVARPFLETLSAQWHETALFCLYNPSARTATVSDSISSPHPLKYELAPLSQVSLAWGSLGRAILAHLSATDIEAVLAGNPRGPLSGRLLPPRRTLMRELALIRSQGFALYEDPRMNVAGVSAPVLHADARVIGCLGVIMPASRFGKSIRQRLPQAITRSARELSVALALQ
ncbi:MAG TPA: IclR family transcriptional regulator [Steroidobacteraceae bacterium]|nr:IclR family transcriptional regulator [Steroidobacteraceae bacterium]